MYFYRQNSNNNRKIYIIYKVLRIIINKGKFQKRDLPSFYLYIQKSRKKRLLHILRVNLKNVSRVYYYFTLTALADENAP